MKRARIQRLEGTDFAVYGQLIDADDERFICYTLERPWLDNESKVSCVRAGGPVTAHRFRGKRPYDVFKLAEWFGRDDVELHIGNLPHDSEGCILLGRSFGDVNGQRGVTDSKGGFGDFMAWAAGEDTIELTIVDAPNMSTAAVAA